MSRNDRVFETNLFHSSEWRQQVDGKYRTKEDSVVEVDGRPTSNSYFRTKFVAEQQKSMATLSCRRAEIWGEQYGPSLCVE